MALLKSSVWPQLEKPAGSPAGAFEYPNTSAQEMNSHFQKQSSPFLASPDTTVYQPEEAELHSLMNFTGTVGFIPICAPAPKCLSSM